MLYAQSEDDLLDAIQKFLAVSDQNGFKINNYKSHLFLKSVEFCGKIMSKTGVRFNPLNIEDILNMRILQKADQLQQLLCTKYWMRLSIPDNSRLSQPLYDLLEKTYKTSVAVPNDLSER